MLTFVNQLVIIMIDHTFYGIKFKIFVSVFDILLYMITNINNEYIVYIIIYIYISYCIFKLYI